MDKYLDTLIKSGSTYGGDKLEQLLLFKLVNGNSICEVITQVEQTLTEMGESRMVGYLKSVRPYSSGSLGVDIENLLTYVQDLTVYIRKNTLCPS